METILQIGTDIINSQPVLNKFSSVTAVVHYAGKLVI